MGKEKKSEFDDIEVVTGMPVADTPTDIIRQGNTLSQMRTEYHTAVAVQKPRDLERIIDNLDKEAQYGGKDFYYSWPVKNKRTKKTEIVEGCSIGAAMAIAREWTNCAIPIEVKETNDAFIFRAAFVDIEKGFTVSRVYRHKKTAVVGKYDASRWEDMEFQKAQSKAIRNVVLAAVPKWLSSRVLRNSKAAMATGIVKEGLDVAREKALSFLAGYGINREQVEVAVGKAYVDWTIEDIVKLRGMCSQILNGDVSAEAMFPPVKKEETEKELAKPKQTEEESAKAAETEKEPASPDETEKSPSKAEILLADLKAAWDGRANQEKYKEWWQANYNTISQLRPAYREKLRTYIKKSEE